MSERVGMPVERTPEQVAAVRRRALPVAVGALICAGVGVAMLLTKQVDEVHPPAVFGAGLASCAVLMGVGIILYAKGTKGVRIALISCVMAMVAGLGAMAYFIKQTKDFRVAMQTRELSNLEKIAAAAREHALANGGLYPESIEVLLQEKRLTQEDLHSPFGNGEAIDKRRKLPPADFEKWYQHHSDYLYFGMGLRLEGAEAQPATRAAFLPAELLVASNSEFLMRTLLTVAWANGKADFLEFDAAKKALRDSNEARRRLGLPEIEKPEAVRKAEEVERQER